ncbi:hypothetical protein NL676_008154 [Syzygium grande]|nr:hypothetical protein NL676_008154 [Syzygium grande]
MIKIYLFFSNAKVPPISVLPPNLGHYASSFPTRVASHWSPLPKGAVVDLRMTSNLPSYPGRAAGVTEHEAPPLVPTEVISPQSLGGESGGRLRFGGPVVGSPRGGHHRYKSTGTSEFRSETFRDS